MFSCYVCATFLQNHSESNTHSSFEWRQSNLPTSPMPATAEVGCSQEPLTFVGSHVSGRSHHLLPYRVGISRKLEWDMRAVTAAPEHWDSEWAPQLASQPPCQTPTPNPHLKGELTRSGKKKSHLLTKINLNKDKLDKTLKLVLNFPSLGKRKT